MLGLLVLATNQTFDYFTIGWHQLNCVVFVGYALIYLLLECVSPPQDY